MAIFSSCAAALPSVLPAYSMLSGNKTKANNPNIVASTRSNKTSSPSFLRRQPRGGSYAICFPRLEARRRISVDIMRNISEEDDEEIQADAILPHDYFLRGSTIAASYGVWIMLKELVKDLCGAQPNWGFVIVGLLMYKGNMCSIEQYMEGRHPVWLETPLAALALIKFLVDCFILYQYTKWTPLNIIMDSLEIVFSYIVNAYFNTFLFV